MCIRDSGHHAVVLFFLPILFMPQPAARDLAVIERDGESRDIQKQGRGAVAEDHLAAWLVANMLRQLEGVFFFREHALQSAVAEFEERDLKGLLPAPRLVIRSGLDRQCGKKNRGGDRKDSDFALVNFHGGQIRKGAGLAVWGVVPKRAGLFAARGKDRATR
jgi:hypothetical protein